MSSMTEHTRMPVDEENKSLFHEIVELLQSPECEYPANVLLIGKTGAGKSALVNTLHKVLTGKYYTIATQGSGGKEQSVTVDLLRYDNCGVLLHRISDESRREMMADVLPKIPNILDCAGLGNENTPKLREILEILIGGYIRPGTSIEALVHMQDKYGIGRLMNIFKEPNPSWKESKIVFMHGCIDAEIPKNLIECLREVLKIYDPSTLIRKYQCEVYVLITKYDVVQDSDETSLSGRTVSEKAMTLEEFERIENSIAQEFSFVGALKSKMLRWVSLTDDTGYEKNPEVDKIALNFIKRLIEPGLPKINAAPSVFETSNMLALFWFRVLNLLPNMRLALVLGLTVAVVIFAVFYGLLRAPL